MCTSKITELDSNWNVRNVLLLKATEHLSLSGQVEDHQITFQKTKPRLPYIPKFEVTTDYSRSQRSAYQYSIVGY